jgi:hypothetical protein
MSNRFKIVDHDGAIIKDCYSGFYYKGTLDKDGEGCGKDCDFDSKGFCNEVPCLTDNWKDGNYRSEWQRIAYIEIIKSKPISRVREIKDTRSDDEKVIADMLLG